MCPPVPSAAATAQYSPLAGPRPVRALEAPLVCVAGQHGLLCRDVAESLAAQGYAVAVAALTAWEALPLAAAQVLLLEGRLDAAVLPGGTPPLPLCLPLVLLTTTPLSELAPRLRASPARPMCRFPGAEPPPVAVARVLSESMHSRRA